MIKLPMIGAVTTRLTTISLVAVTPAAIRLAAIRPVATRPVVGRLAAISRPSLRGSDFQ
jgi:hypothetical protein